MTTPRLHFTRQALVSRAGLDDDTVRYWIRAGVLRAESGGGKGHHLRFSRLELGLAVLLARLRELGLTSTALAGVAAKFHAAIDWIAGIRLDHEQAAQVDELVQLRVQFDGDPIDLQQAWESKMAGAWFDLPPSAVRFAERVSIDEWREHYGFGALLAGIALTRPKGECRPVRFTKGSDGEWRLGPSQASDFIQIDADSLAKQLWSHER